MPPKKDKPNTTKDTSPNPAKTASPSTKEKIVKLITRYNTIKKATVIKSKNLSIVNPYKSITIVYIITCFASMSSLNCLLLNIQSNYTLFCF